MTLTELEEVIKQVLPTASMGFDNEGQVIIFTGLTPLEEDEDSELVEFTGEISDNALSSDAEEDSEDAEGFSESEEL